jgi:2-methylisocitrate lyase-like PEP mutase family enzyme
LLSDTGLAGCSVEDWSGESIYDAGLAAERVAAAAEAAHRGPVHLVLTGRAENHLYDHGGDLDDTVARLRAYRAAGATCVYAPGLTDLADIRRVVAGCDAPVNVLALGGGPTVPQLADAGVRRVSTGGALAWAAYGALERAAMELRDAGTYGFLDTVVTRSLRDAAFG